MALCGKRIDWKAQQNSSGGREGGCGESSEEWWEQWPKLRREGSPRKERQLGWIQPGSDVLGQQAQADTASCSLHLTGLCAWRETLRTKNQTWQLGRSDTICEFLSGCAFLGWEPKMLWLSRWITRCASLFIPHLCCSWLPTDCAAEGCPSPGRCWCINPHQSSWQL